MCTPARPDVLVAVLVEHAPPEYSRISSASRPHTHTRAKTPSHLYWTVKMVAAIWYRYIIVTRMVETSRNCCIYVLSVA